MTVSIVLPAPAKLNLFLHIVGRRPDGYHLLQTVFQFVDLADRIELKIDASGEITRKSAVPGVAAEDDLTVRAAALLQRKTGCAQGIEISLKKNLPMGGGLGGGSSDAATVLHGCNHLWECGLSDQELAEIGLELGADVPVFVRGFACWAEGVGEQLTAVDLPQPWYVILCPGVHLSTAEIFSREGLTRDCEALTIADFLQGQGVNVFEPEAREMSSEIGEALDWLGQFSPSRLTGSGSCLFAAFSDRISAQKVAARIPSQWQGYVAEGMNRSPLFEAMQKS